MTRLQQKCFWGATGVHGLLCLTVLVSSAFLARKPDDAPQVVTLINAPLTDEATQGGTPPPPTPAAETPAPAPAPAPQPAPAPVLPPPTAPEVPVSPAPRDEPKTEPKALPKTKTEEITPTKGGEMKVIPKNKASEKAVVDTSKKGSQETKRPLNVKTDPKTPPRTAPKIDLSKTTKRDPAAVERDAAAAEAERESVRRRNLAKAIGAGASSLNKSVTAATTVEATGGEGGGQAMVNYGQYVAATYKAESDDAVTKSSMHFKGTVTFRASVTIGRDGRVISSTITKSSGDPEFDKLIKRVLDGVTKIRGFPSGSSDTERTFNLVFDLTPSQQG